MKPYIIGVTGNIGSGKTTFCKMLSNHGFPVFYADEQAKIVYNNPIIAQKLKDTFKIKNLEKETLKKIVFSNKNKQFNDIIFPEVFKMFNEWVANKEVAVIESALLFESSFYKQMDFIVYLHVDPKESLKRLENRGISIKDAKKRMKYQYDKEKAVSLISSDYLIYENEKIELMPDLVDCLLMTLSVKGLKWTKQQKN